MKNDKRRNNLMLTKMWTAQLLLNTRPFSSLPLKLRFVLPNMQALFLEHTSLPKQITTSIGSVIDLLAETRDKEQHIINEMKPNQLIECYFCAEPLKQVSLCDNCAVTHQLTLSYSNCTWHVQHVV